MKDRAIEIIKNKQAVLGLELGSTRVKGILLGPDQEILASGSCEWENTLDKDTDAGGTVGVWTYSLEEVHYAISKSYGMVTDNLRQQYGVDLEGLACLGISAMMHGYLVFNAEGELLVPFRTWRNNITAEAASELTSVFQYPIPQRWSIAHLYQAMLRGEEHVRDVAYITTLAGYVHWLLSGQKVLGICDASGMFPIDLEEQGFDRKRMDKFDRYVVERGLPQPWKLADIFPRVLMAGEEAGELSEQGNRILDPSGKLASGCLMCPPEGDAGTGMVATNCVRPKTGNVSAGTSVFAMIVLEKELSAVHEEIDLVCTPDGNLAGMAHSNNCTSDYDAWIELFRQAFHVLGFNISTWDLYDKLLAAALSADKDAGGLLSYCYVSGEHITGFSEGRPLVVRPPHAPFGIGNFMRSLLFSSLCALRTGLDVLTETESVQVERICGHGGFFKSGEVGQKVMAAAMKTSVSVLQGAGEGGAWGMALLARFACLGRDGGNISLADFLDETMDKSQDSLIEPEPDDVEGFEAFFRRYHKGLPIESAAVEFLSGEV